MNKLLKQFVVLIILLSIFLTGAFIVQEQIDDAEWQVKMSQYPEEIRQIYESDVLTGKAEFLGIKISYSKHCDSSVIEYIGEWLIASLQLFIPIMLVLWLVFLASLKFLSNKSQRFVLSDLTQVVTFFIIFVSIYLTLIIVLTQGKIILSPICF